MIDVSLGNEQSKPLVSGTTQKPSREATYEVQLWIGDVAQVQIDDKQESLFEVMHLDFDRFVDRIAALIKGQNWIGTAPKTKLFRTRGVRNRGDGDRAIQRENRSGTWENVEGDNVAELLSVLSFRLVDECVDDSALYS